MGEDGNSSIFGQHKRKPEGPSGIATRAEWGPGPRTEAWEALWRHIFTEVLCSGDGALMATREQGASDASQ